MADCAPAPTEIAMRLLVLLSAIAMLVVAWLSQRGVFGPETRAVVSEPIGGIGAAWQKVPESSALIVENGEVDIVPFTPRAP